MPTTTTALQAASAGAPFEVAEVPVRDLRDDDILIDIAYAGICHSDIHQVREEWGKAIFPMTPGHEIAGVVSAVGSGVTKHKIGDRVGVGCMVDSCGECEYCKDGEEQYCLKGAVMTYNGTGYDGEETKGGYAKQVAVSERFVCSIPDGIGLDEAAPLLCAGITTWAPLKRWGVGPGSKVAVIGLGGLGHMGVKFAAALGAEVTVLSRSDAKADDSAALGATAHVATADPLKLKKLRGSFDVVLNTVSADLDLKHYIALLKPLGALVNVGMPPSAWSIPPGSVIGGSRVVAGSNIGGIQATQDMLDFCAEKGIGASVETVAAAEVDAAYERVVAGDVRYRFVIDTATIGA
ncbi:MULTISPECIES: NAD(P)-dependent alcohol dehydrogenase [unclassified Nocardioides]|uniref:NAD(P)-dependent alcohol dehydrogenase n=1 Tax=unclassified Nocardioides TaxID=2615069 RepID=UPI0006F4412C|nr:MULTISPECIES: NAD(P)-dependent alcohol dehydrogenase [unclassified Nocardioides]KQY57268.1 alcohol dehydrogenase [Nocardioides sp. Root140]KRF11911.1 alcohol dehydrogenase [Nocardioides sp. Soil796]